MRQALAVVILIALATPAAAERRRAARIPQRILSIGAHPDDEILLAPLLGRECVERGAQCALLVMTRGEAGGAADVRSAEMHAAAAMLHATLTLWNYPDVMTGFDAAWPGAVDAIAFAIESAAPTVVYTFDPRHGSTCHPAHRVLGALVLEALAGLDAPPPLVFVETTSDFRSAAAEAVAIDVSAQWSYLVRDAEIHASQFSAAQRDALASTPPERRRVWLLDADAAPRATYTLACP
jgi:LmbE family N-acetylglucosaminyl deacetylase